MSEEDELLKRKAEAFKTGTTTVGLVCSDGVILASDKRATMGYFIASKDVQKVAQIDDRIAISLAGSVADAQALVRLMRAELKLYRMNHGKAPTVKAASSLLANIMFQYKIFPFYVQLLVAGVEDKPEVYSLDPLGGVTEEKFASTGSGSPVAYGLLESQYVKNGSIKENMPVAVNAIKVAMSRDCATGEGIDLVTITKAGFKRHESEEIAKLVKTE